MKDRLRVNERLGVKDELGVKSGLLEAKGKPVPNSINWLDSFAAARRGSATRSVVFARASPGSSLVASVLPRDESPAGCLLLSTWCLLLEACFG